MPFARVLFLPVLDDLDPLPDRFADRRVADRFELGVEEALCGVELGDDPHRPKRHEGDLDPLDGERVVLEFGIEFPDTRVELGDGLARHRPGGVEQQETGAPGLGVFSEGHRREGLLVGEGKIRYFRSYCSPQKCR